MKKVSCERGSIEKIAAFKAKKGVGLHFPVDYGTAIPCNAGQQRVPPFIIVYIIGRELCLLYLFAIDTGGC